MAKDDPKIMFFRIFLTLYLSRFAIFNPICTITLYVQYLTLHVIFFAFCSNI